MENRLAHLTLISIAAVAAPLLGSSDLDASLPAVTLRVVNEAKVDTRVLGRARKEAIEIFSRAGVRLVWLDCSSGSGDWADENPCHRERGNNEFWLRVTTHKPLRTTGEMLGYSEFGPSRGSRSAGVIFPAVAELAARFHCDHALILGAAIVHEAGHLLLGADAHFSTGVMVSHWNREQLLLIEQGKLNFARQQAVLLRRKASGVEADIP